jgi:hypothetical protein
MRPWSRLITFCALRKFGRTPCTAYFGLLAFRMTANHASSQRAGPPPEISFAPASAQTSAQGHEKESRPRSIRSAPSVIDEEEAQDSGQPRTSHDKLLQVGSIAHRNDGSFEGSFAATSRRLDTASIIPYYRRRSYYLDGWTDGAIWRAACIECCATSALVYLSGQFSVTIIGYGTKQIGAYVGIYNIVLLSTFIYATGPSSGGHLNPLITWATMLSGICPVPRGILYMCGQLLGAALAGGLLLGSWGHARAIEYVKASRLLWILNSVNEENEQNKLTTFLETLAAAVSSIPP